MLPAIQQLRTVGAFGRLIASGALASLRGSGGELLLRPRVSGRVPGISGAQAARYTEATGASPDLYVVAGRTVVPPTFFSCWALPALAHALTLARLPFNFTRVLHAASSVRIHRLHEPGEQLSFTASIEGIERNGNRVRIDQLLEIVDAHGDPVQTAAISLALPDPRRVPRSRVPELVPAEGRLLGELLMEPEAGWKYARLSGDFNPVHWSRLVARLSGMTAPIAHGFDLMARTCHAVIERRAGRDPSRLRYLEVAFRKPVPLPSRLFLFAGEAEGQGRIPFWIAAGKDTPVHLSGHAEIQP